MPLSTPRDLFVHELSDTMSAERISLELLGGLQQEAQHPEAKRAFEEHEAETRRQIGNLEEAFAALGEQPEPVTCHAAEGLRREHEALHEGDPSPEVLAMGIVAGAAKQEHYEIAAYTTLVRMAKDLEERDIARLLEANLEQEKAMATRVEGIAKELGKQARAMMEEQASAGASAAG